MLTVIVKDEVINDIKVLKRILKNGTYFCIRPYKTHQNLFQKPLACYWATTNITHYFNLLCNVLISKLYRFRNLEATLF